jgi:hypothetical protein
MDAEEDDIEEDDIEEYQGGCRVIRMTATTQDGAAWQMNPSYKGASCQAGR